MIVSKWRHQYTNYKLEMSKVKDLGRVLRDDKSAKDNKNYEIRLPKRNSELRIGKFLYKQQKIVL